MDQIDYAFFTNDYFRILTTIKENEVSIGGRLFAPLIQQDIANILHYSRPKINKMMKELIIKGYIRSLMKGRIELTEKANAVIDRISLGA